MSGGQGDDTGNGEFRMSEITESKILEEQNINQFSGAAVPELVSGEEWGQWVCHVQFSYLENWYPFQYLDIYPGRDYAGLYKGYSGWYSRFSVTQDRDCWHVDADIDYDTYGRSNFFYGYWLEWDSAYWPTGYSPNLNPVGIACKFRVCECASTTGSSVTNIKVWVLGTDQIVPPIRWQTTFLGVDGCHNTWIETWNRTDSADLFQDVEVYLLFGFRDAWVADWSQDIYIEPLMMEFFYYWG
jgi:hypothetical protein